MIYHTKGSLWYLVWEEVGLAMVWKEEVNLHIQTYT